ncbi:hypothetical protein ACSNOI_35475 [Actinomadura kijaniata]|uniref:hypothetical protein n=1 Tax=Actinomadura kijaniata TaxID=46161 RepID=UPI003F1B0763
MTTPPNLPHHDGPGAEPRVPYWCDPHPADTDLLPRDGRRHLGVLEQVVRRQWDPAATRPAPEVIAAIDRLAALPGPIATQIAQALTGGLWVGHGAVPGLDHLAYLAGQPVGPGTVATWDAIPGVTVWQSRTVAVGTGTHVSASLVDHEIGHVMERLRGAAQTPEWDTIMFRCRPLLRIERWHDPYEWWAEAWAMVITRQLGWLHRTLSEHEPVTAMVVSYYVRHYGLEV